MSGISIVATHHRRFDNLIGAHATGAFLSGCCTSLAATRAADGEVQAAIGYAVLALLTLTHTLWAWWNLLRARRIHCDLTAQQARDLAQRLITDADHLDQEKNR